MWKLHGNGKCNTTLEQKDTLFFRHLTFAILERCISDLYSIQFQLTKDSHTDMFVVDADSIQSETDLKGLKTEFERMADQRVSHNDREIIRNPKEQERNYVIM